MLRAALQCSHKIKGKHVRQKLHFHCQSQLNKYGNIPSSERIKTMQKSLNEVISLHSLASWREGSTWASRGQQTMMWFGGHCLHQPVSCVIIAPTLTQHGRAFLPFLPALKGLTWDSNSKSDSKPGGYSLQKHPGRRPLTDSHFLTQNNTLYVHGALLLRNSDKLWAASAKLALLVQQRASAMSSVSLTAYFAADITDCLGCSSNTAEPPTGWTWNFLL